MSQIRDALIQCAYLVENSAKEKCPVDTGRLKASITHEVDGDGFNAVATIGTNVDYAPYIEYGTGLFNVNGEGRKTRWSYQDVKGDWHSTIGMKPQPFLTPAFLENQSNIIGILTQAVDEELKGFNT